MDRRDAPGHRGEETPRERISRLSAAILRIIASLDVDTVLREVVDNSRALTGARNGAITTVDEAGFVETPRYTGAVYRASGWVHVGTTQGRGRIRPRQALRQAPKGRLAPTPPPRLAAGTQSVASSPSSDCVFSQVDDFNGPTERLHLPT